MDQTSILGKGKQIKSTGRYAPSHAVGDREKGKMIVGTVRVER